MSAKRAALAFLLLLLPLAGAARAGVAVDRAWKEGDTAHVEFTYTNTTDSTHSIVKIVCAPPGGEGRGQKATLYLSNPLGGGISPGYTATQTLTLSLKEGRPEDIACEAFEQIMIMR